LLTLSLLSSKGATFAASTCVRRHSITNIEHSYSTLRQRLPLLQAHGGEYLVLLLLRILSSAGATFLASTWLRILRIAIVERRGYLSCNHMAEDASYCHC
jgi:hypothetical protein